MKYWMGVVSKAQAVAFRFAHIENPQQEITAIARGMLIMKLVLIKSAE